MSIKKLYENTELTQQQIADALGIHWKHVFLYIKANYSLSERKRRKAIRYSNSKQGTKNPMHGMIGKTHHNYVGVVSDCKGYLLVLKPDWYTGRKGSKHVFQHHVVVCEKMGLTEIPKGWCVHHCDENKQNNRFDNLVLMTLTDHVRFHKWLEGATTRVIKSRTLKWVEAHGTPFLGVMI
jgi:hypothetical protein